MKRVALFGGSFNPPHVAHQLVALYVLQTQPVDELWFVPVWDHVFHKALAPFADRVAMCELAAAPIAGARVDRCEEELARQPGFAGSRTFELVELLRAREPGLELRLVIGTDILRDTHKWYRWDDLARAAPPIVIARPGHPVPEGQAHTVVMPDISSTRIRDALSGAASEPLAGLLPARVLEYIEAHGLYRPDA